MAGALVVALALWLTPAGPVPATFGADASSAEVKAAPGLDGALENLAERGREWRGETPRETACQALIELMCDAAGPQFCQLIRREAERRPMTDQDEQHCREVLDDQDKLEELLRSIRRT